MTIRRPLLVLAALPALLAVEQAQAADTLGSPDSSAAPSAYACEVARCSPGQSVGFRQFALQGATVRPRRAVSWCPRGSTPSGSPGPSSRGSPC